MRNEEISARDALTINLWVFRSVGIWAADIKSPSLRLIYNIYGAIIISTLSMIYFSTEIIYVIVIWGNLEAISEISFLLLTHIGTVVKLFSFLMRRERVEKLVENLAQRNFLPRRNAHRDFLMSTVRVVNRDNVIFILMCASTVIGWAIVPMVDSGETRRLPLKTWFPFDISNSPIFEVIYAYQTAAVMMNAFMNAMMDTFASSLMALAGAQLDMLRHDLSKLGREDEEDGENPVEFKTAVTQRAGRISKVGRAEDKLKGKLKTGNVPAEFPPRSLQDDILHERIVGCIEHHGAIIRFANEINDVFGIGILVQFAVSSIILCLTCFELTLLSPGSLQFCSMLLYQGCMLLEIFFYCWHGNGIICKSTDLMIAPFQCQWTACSPRVKNTLRIVMCRMQRAHKLTVGRVFNLSLETFSMILRTAYSFYAVLQRVHSRVIEAEKRDSMNF
ncbi:odorant receptor 46a-like [Neodiprion pinetum]|uniref:Odorant receptor n=1 Tax=Neodiprion lecontei TaxID=441921 RepID=A0A6J0BDT8_NEOLC|nr:odorant receptor 46a-like [Neodiprion lecontei]XP_046472358.1 odorant receptor 46a-like [Neodiprion pinetum]